MQPTPYKPALLVAGFVPTGGGSVEVGYEYLRSLWKGCRALGMTEPMPNMPYSVELPTIPGPSEDFKTIAACTRSDPVALYSAYVFIEHDVVGLVALLAPNDPECGLEQWTELYRQWNEAVGREPEAQPSDDILGEVLIFQALQRGDVKSNPADLGRLVAREAPVDPDGVWANAFDRTDQGFLLWEARAERAATTRRSLYVLAPERKETKLDEWVWASEGDNGLRPLARYLVHAAKVSYEARLLERLGSVQALIRTSDDRSKALLRDLVPEGPDAAPSLAGLMDASRALDQTRLGNGGLVWTITNLRQLHRTVEIATANLELNAPDLERHGEGLTLVGRDLSIARLVSREIDNDLLYLGATSERADAARALAEQVVGQKLQERRDRLTLIQASALGAVVMALTSVQALSYRIPLAPVLQTPAIATVAAFALALPLVVLRLARVVPPSAPYRWADVFSSTLLGAAGGWFAVELAWRQTYHALAPLVTTLSIAAVTAAAIGASVRQLGRRRDGRRWPKLPRG